MAFSTPERFFGANSFYTTAANRMSRHIFKNAVTDNDIIQLYKKNTANIDKYCGEKATLDTTLYLRGPESKGSSEEITFKDFINSTEENEIFYTINLVKHVSGKGKTLKSSFFIGVEQKDASGKILSRKVVGNPDFERSGVCDYVIRRIIADKSGKSIVFEIEKQIEDSKGTSFRYMVETFMF